MDEISVVSIVKKKVSGLSNMNVNDICKNDYLSEDLGMESYAIAELFIELNEFFNINLNKAFTLNKDFSVCEIVRMIIHEEKNKSDTNSR